MDDETDGRCLANRAKSNRPRTTRHPYVNSTHEQVRSYKSDHTLLPWARTERLMCSVTCENLALMTAR